jgi:flagellar M-ring protein FliF
MKGLSIFLQRLKANFQALPAPQKLLYSVTTMLVAAGLIYLVRLGNSTDYTLLYSGLSESDMGSVVEALKKDKTPYKLTDAGSVAVPSDKLYEVRLKLAAEGMPRGQGSGFEIFDQQKLGSTEFVQKINYQRALQGELARTILEMNEVKECRVHLALPDDSLFQEDKKSPTAAVVLKLHTGAHLNQNQIRGIVHLVASAVKGLDEDKVTIISTDGQVMYKKNGEGDSFQMTGSRLEYKTRLEDSLRRKVQTMLDQVLGSSRVITRVTADLDFNQSDVEQDTYDPDSAVVRSQQRSIENSDTDPTPRGNPDAPVNIESKLMQSTPPKDQQPPNGQPPNGQQPKDQQAKDQQKKFSRQRETVNYEINRVIRKTIQAPGYVKRLSIAVIVDGAYAMKPDASGKEKLSFVGRTPDEMKSIEDIAKKAVGFDESRGDQITVSNIPFATEPTGNEGVKSGNRWLDLLKSYQKVIFNVVLALLVFFFLVRPFMKRLQQMSREIPKLPKPGTPTALPGVTPEVGQTLSLEGQSEAPPSPRDKILTLVQQNPDKATEIIRTWLREGN